jgi:hypothetical protein
MLPGVVLPKSNVERIKIGDKVTVLLDSKDNGESFGAICVGRASMSGTEMKRSKESDGKGTVLQNIHFWRDKLWEVGSKEDPPIFPSTVNNVQIPDSNNNNLSNHNHNNSLESDIKTNIEKMSLEYSDEKGSNENNNNTIHNNICVPTGSEGKQEIETESNTLNENNNNNNNVPMDEILQSCFMGALKYKLKETDLPILLSHFYANHVIACKLPELPFIDLKKTKWKKVEWIFKNKTRLKILVFNIYHTNGRKWVY